MDADLSDFSVNELVVFLPQKKFLGNRSKTYPTYIVSLFEGFFFACLFLFRVVWATPPVAASNKNGSSNR